MTNDIARAQALPSARPAAAPGVAADAGSDGWIFFLFQVLVLYEYIGLKRFVGPLQLLRPSTLLAFLLVVLVLKRLRRIDLFDYRQGQLHAFFIFMTAASVSWAVIRSYAFSDITPHVGYFGFGIIALYAITTRERLSQFGCTCAITVLALVATNIGKLLSSVRLGAFEAAPFLGDGNDFAWGMNVFLPIMLFAVIGPNVPLWRRGLCAAGVAAALFAIVGTQSRGAAIALAAAGLYYWAFVTKRKALGAAAMAVALMAALAAAPSHYLDRMNSVADYQDDGSAQGRLRAWKAATQMALDYPLGVGAGNFNSAYGRFYMPADSGAWGASRWISTHSVYFKVLAEYGFIGLFVLLWLLVANFTDNIRTRRIIDADPGRYEFPSLWPAVLNMSLIAYALSGVFLGGIAYPHLYLITGLTLGARRSLLQAAAAAPVTAPAAGASARPAGRSVTLWPERLSAGAMRESLATRRGEVR